MSEQAPLVAGIFVGGRSSRMGGRPKGLLPCADAPTIVERTIDLLESVGARVVLVGTHPAYASLPRTQLADAPGIEGPLAGLVALLEEAGADPCLAVACDMPFLTSALVQRLIADPRPGVVAAQRRGRWEPFFARWDPRLALPLAHALAREPRASLTELLVRCGAHALTLAGDGEEQRLDDWDTPEDVAAPHENGPAGLAVSRASGPVCEPNRATENAAGKRSGVRSG